MKVKNKKQKNLVIVESPSKAKTIKNYLGKNYNVLASMGHVRDLPKSRLGVDVKDNYKPKYINIRGKAPLINSLKKASKSASITYIASDPDREGEAIAWHLGYLLGLSKNGKNRVTFNEITKNAVKNAFKKPRSIESNLVDSQQARRILDRLVGYSISPILWKKVKRGLSAGRVQSVALGLILNKEKKIVSFKPQEYWSLDSSFGFKRHKFKASFYGIKNKKIKLTAKKDVSHIISLIDKKKDFLIDKVSFKKSQRKAPNPFTTSTLQQAANTVLNFHARRTMRVAQQLYEGISLPKTGNVGLITYMRTDSTRLSKTAQDMSKKYIVNEFGKKFYHLKNKVKKSGNVQDAHEAVRPTNIFYVPSKIKNYLTRDQFRLYRLIWTRLIASQMESQKIENRTFLIKQNNVFWEARGVRVLFNGWTEVLKNFSSKDNLLPSLKEGDKIKLIELFPKQHFTQPPARYSEATLIKKLEELGVGRPSTYAPTMDTLQRRGYIGFEKKKIIPTDLGCIVQKVVKKSFPEVADYQFTSRIENELDKVETGNIKWQKVIDQFYKPFKKEVDSANKYLKEVPVFDRIAPVLCNICGGLMLIRRSRRGEFYACARFPECHGTKSIMKKIGIKCPKCKIGDVIVKHTKKGRTFYGCSRYPKCDFASWTNPKIVSNKN